jgi:hypothetical protein
MKILGKALAAAGLLALGACGGADEPAANNVAADNVVLDDLGDENLLGTDLGNDLLLDANVSTELDNEAVANTVGNTQ